MSKLEVVPGDTVGLTTPVRGLDTGGANPFAMIPREAQFVVKDCVDSGFYDYDSRLVVMELPAAIAFLDRGPVVRWVEIKLDDLFATDQMKTQILGVLQPYGVTEVIDDIASISDGVEGIIAREMPADAAGNVSSMSNAILRAKRALMYSDVGYGPPEKYRVIDWKGMNRNLFSALRIQKVVLGLFFLIIVVVAAFNIVGTQLIVAKERLKEVSTLIALGASRIQLWKVFVAHGFALGCIGVILGVALGRGVVAVINSIDFSLDAKVYMINELPARLNWSDALVVAAGSAAVVLLSCVFSSLRATRVNPVDGLRKIG
jgi:lipoprotein-releasing system permease protein